MKLNKSQEVLESLKEESNVNMSEFSTKDRVEQQLIAEIQQRQRRLKPSIWKDKSK